MSNKQTEQQTEKKPKKRKPLWLMTPVGERMLEVGGEKEAQTLYSMEKFTSLTDLRKSLEGRELDQTNVHGIVLLRAEATPISASLKTQVVLKFGREAGEDDDDDDGIPVAIDGETGETEEGI